jgi:PhoPQ-activated pathogenicity-related protein
MGQSIPGSLRASEPSIGPLAEYVRSPDPSYRWEKVSEGKIGRARYAELSLISQTWKDIVWKHQLFVITPANVDPSARHALLMISGGSWDAKRKATLEIMVPAGNVGDLVTIAEQLREPVALLLDVPNQPLFGPRYEDSIIAYTFDQFLKTGDSKWPLLLPMVNSAVRAMDATQAFCRQASSLDIREFTVTGISKRGWTTWLTGAVDPRVVGIAPVVIDMLNSKAHSKLEVQSFGHYSEQIRDYTDYNLQQRMESPRGEELRSMCDPYSYRDKLTIPKLLIMGTNDPYWPLESANLYWNELVGEKYLLYVPNAGHGFSDPRHVGSLLAFQEHIARGKRLPKLKWTFTDRAEAVRLTVESDLKPQSVVAWTAKADTRDFRGSTWNSQSTAEENGAYHFDLAIRTAGYAAVIGEAQFENGSIPYYFSTNVRVVGKHAKATGAARPAKNPPRSTASALKK